MDLEKPYKKVMALKNLLLKEPENVFSFSELGKLRTHVGITGKARFISLISKYPAIFALHKDEADVLWCGFSLQAQQLADQELTFTKCHEVLAVQKLRKLLMMSVDRRIRVPKIAQLRRDLGFPADFQSRMIYAYPQYFKVVEEKFKNEDGPVLELTCWDPSLAVTSLEMRSTSMSEYNSAGEPLFKVCVSKALRLSKKQKEGIDKFQERPFISPYADSKDFNKNTIEFEKRQVALLHEILSMTLEKKTVFDYLTHFRKEFRLPQSILAMVLKHHYIFYVSRKGGRFTIFLKEAYEGGSLIQKNEFNLLKEQYMALMERRNLEKVEDAKTNNEGVINDDSFRREELTIEEDPDFDALISLCQKIRKDSVEEAPFVSDCKSKVIVEMQKQNTTGMGSNEDDRHAAIDDLCLLEEEESGLFTITTDEDEGPVLDD